MPSESEIEPGTETTEESEMDLEHECGICMLYFVQPVTLPCKHKYCANCLQSTMRKCPYCQRGFSLPLTLDRAFQAECHAHNHSKFSEALDYVLKNDKFVKEHHFKNRHRIKLEVGNHCSSTTGDSQKHCTIFVRSGFKGTNYSDFIQSVSFTYELKGKEHRIEMDAYTIKDDSWLENVPESRADEINFSLKVAEPVSVKVRIVIEPRFGHQVYEYTHKLNLSPSSEPH